MTFLRSNDRRGAAVLRQRIPVLLVVACLLVYVGLAIQVYRSNRDPEAFRGWDRPFGWLLGPNSRSLNRSAESRLESALAILNDAALPAPERIRAYRDELRLAETLLVRSLRAQPAQALTLARLTAVRFELEPPLTAEDNVQFLAMIRTASEMAPRVPAVQVSLGELLLRLGREDEAWEYLSRAVTLDPAVAADAVKLPIEMYMAPERVRRALPPEPEVLVALQKAYFDRGDLQDYLAAIELVLDRATPRLLVCFGNASLRVPDPDRLISGLERIGSRTDLSFEAERRYQLSRARQAKGNLPMALADALAARELLPEVPRMSEHIGDLSVAAGRPDEAIAAYREALALVARDSGRKYDRARLYARIGQAEEAAGRPGRAYDAYKQAVLVDEADETARIGLQRLKELARVGGEAR